MKHISNHIKLFLVLVLLVFATQACDPYEQESFQEELVVESVLVANEPLNYVRVSHTIPAEDAYETSTLEVQDAVVKIHELDAEGQILSTTIFEYSSIARYKSAESFIPKAGVSYQLDIIANVNGTEHHAKATTTVPFVPESSQLPEGQVVYNSNDFSFPIQQINGIDQRKIIFEVYSQNAIASNLTPFYQTLIDNGIGKDISDLRSRRSEILNENNYPSKNGSRLIKFPWDNIPFYGENHVSLSVIDQNLYDILRSQRAQLSVGSIAPGEIHNLLYNVEGAIGLFGSMSSIQTNIDVKR